MPEPNARTLGALRRIANAVEVQCEPCSIANPWMVYELIEKMGASMPLAQVPEHLWIGCGRGRFNRHCRAALVITSHIMLSEMPERFLVRCTGVVDGRACRRHKDVVSRWIVKQRGDMPVDTFLKSLRCLACKTTAAELE